jgi:GDSL-like Lipase/Acylhydrolase
LPNAAKIQNWFLLSRVEVVASDAAGAIVAFGDSITDGTRSTPDTNNRWPDHLAGRLLGQGLKLAILNAAIAGFVALGHRVCSPNPICKSKKPSVPAPACPEMRPRDIVKTMPGHYTACLG